MEMGKNSTLAQKEVPKAPKPEEKVAATAAQDDLKEENEIQ